MAANDYSREQFEHWNGPGGQRWVKEQERLDRFLAPLGAAAVALAAPKPGERVVDIGCGCGATTVELAQRVGPSGSVLGADLSAPMLEVARERARGVPQVRFEQCDAGKFAFAGDAQLLFSRFGVMFFPDPPAAFANLRRALAPRGRLCFACWRTDKENPWINLPFEAAVSVLGRPPQPPPEAPGPFSLASEQRVRELLGGAGFEHVALTAHDQELVLSDSGIDGAVSFAVDAGPVSRLLLNADPAAVPEVLAAVKRALEPHVRGSRAALTSGSWLVTARAP